MNRKQHLFQKLFSYIFVILLTCSASLNMQIDENSNHSQKGMDQPQYILCYEDTAEAYIDSFFITNLNCNDILSLHKKTGTNLSGFSKKTYGYNVFTIPNSDYLCGYFLHKINYHTLIFAASTFSMRWIIKYIHYKNGVKYQVSSVLK